MLTIRKNLRNKIYLEDRDIVDLSFNVKYSLYNDIGVAASGKINGGDVKDILDIPAQYNQEERMFYADFQLIEPKGKYYRLIFTIYDIKGNYITSKYAIQDVELESTGARLVPMHYFRDYILNPQIDEEIRDKILAFPESGIEELLLSAQGDLETECELSFTPRTVENETHDWFQDNLRETFWQIQLFQYPVISIQSYALYYGQTKIVDLPIEALLLNKIMGTLEYIPTQGQPFFTAYYNTGYEATHFMLATKLGAPRIPDMFRVSYTYGIDFMNVNEAEQAEIRGAISRQALIKGTRISPEFLTGSVSQAVDGASYSVGYRGLEWLQNEKEQLTKWIDAFKRKYNKQFKTIAI